MLVIIKTSTRNEQFAIDNQFVFIDSKEKSNITFCVNLDRTQLETLPRFLLESGVLG